MKKFFNKLLTFVKNNKKKSFLLFILIIWFISRTFGNKSEKFNIRKTDLEEVKIGNIKKIVTATGNISPSDVVEVGAQFTGIARQVYVDFNDKVKKDQILAILDTEQLERKIEQVESNIKVANSALRYAEQELKRARELYKNNYISKSELDQVENHFVKAKEEVNITVNELKQAKTQLEYAYIRSPIDGVIIEKKVEVGQTVAAGLTTPVLFKVANNLAKMKIETSISEGDISLIKEGKKVEFYVDAFKNKEFKGTIKQIRYNPTTEQNVVIYNVIIDIENKDSLLLPGMTAYVSITIDSAEQVLIIPNTVFRFKVTKELKKIFNNALPNQEQASKLREVLKDKDNTIIYTIKDNKPKLIVVKKGINDITNTQIISGDLKSGDKVISNYLIPIEKKK